jgi:hypothetical protein
MAESRERQDNQEKGRADEDPTGGLLTASE